MAAEIFGISDFEILNAIECHTTLRGNPSKLDMIIFIADKMQWDKKYSEPFIEKVTEGLEISLEKGVFAYIQYGFNTIKVKHPWFIEAFKYLKECESGRHPWTSFN